MPTSTSPTADNPGDVSAPAPGIEGGRVDALGVTLTHDDFHCVVPGVPGTPAGTCFSPLPPAPCTVTMTVSLGSLGIKRDSGLYSTTGGSFYYFAIQEPALATRVSLGFSNEARCHGSTRRQRDRNHEVTYLMGRAGARPSPSTSG